MASDTATALTDLVQIPYSAWDEDQGKYSIEMEFGITILADYDEAADQYLVQVISGGDILPEDAAGPARTADGTQVLAEDVASNIEGPEIANIYLDALSEEQYQQYLGAFTAVTRVFEVRSSGRTPRVA